jgi:hypothetical protein
MDQSVLNIFNIVLSATGAKVPILVEIPLKVTVNCLSNGVAPDVELPVFVQKGSLAILLDDVGSLFAVYVRIANYLADLAQFAANGDSAASVGVLTWLDNPELGAHRGILC